MSKVILLLACFLCCADVFAQQHNVDSLTYELQRARINAMLLHRKEKYGQYDQSVNMHSGIFGMQTKKDIRRSNAILMDIDSTDDEIFRQIKILLDYHTVHEHTVVTKSQEIVTRDAGYITAVNTLKQQNADLKANLQKQQDDFDKSQWIYRAIILLMLASILVLLFKKRAVKI